MMPTPTYKILEHCEEVYYEEGASQETIDLLMKAFYKDHFKMWLRVAEEMVSNDLQDDAKEGFYRL